MSFWKRKILTGDPEMRDKNIYYWKTKVIIMEIEKIQQKDEVDNS